MIKIGIIGCGFMGKMHVNCFRALQNVRVVGVSDIRQDKAKEIANLVGARVVTDANELINNKEIDAISILLPTHLHKELVIKTAQAKKHIFCEKPLALTVKDAEEMIKETRKEKVKLMIGMVLRFWSEYIEFKRIVDSEIYGKLTTLTCTRLSSRPVFGWDKWYFDPKQSGGAALDLHIHDTDYIYYLLGKPKSVYSLRKRTNKNLEYIYTNYKYKDTVVNAEGGWVERSFGFVQAIRGVFEDGTVLEYNSKNQPLTIYGKEKAELVNVPESKVNSINTDGNISELGGYYNEVKYWIECLQNDRYPERITPEDAKVSLEIVLKEIKSAEIGKEIFL
ncbi:MAG: Gfo/Idh/MocA family oxidoreductase [Atribacteria sp.]|nr:Gfo/Idh/MocA family oxidoreductase [Candidatus Atribacteria bacterium]MBU4226975.1 Gfo/Idh/MocA family oxidoreductase [bacterium]